MILSQVGEELVISHIHQNSSINNKLLPNNF